MARLAPNNNQPADTNLGEVWRDRDPALPNGVAASVETCLGIPDTAASNVRHDQQHGPWWLWPRIKIGWNAERLMPSRELTDEIIEFRRAQGYFSDAHREAIRKLIAAKNARRRDE